MCKLDASLQFYGQNRSQFLFIFFVVSQSFELISWKTVNRQVPYFDTMGHIVHTSYITMHLHLDIECELLCSCSVMFFNHFFFS